MDVKVRPKGRLSVKELMLSNCSAEDSWEFLGQQGDPNQSILKEINSEYSLEGLVLKLQYFGHLTWRASSLEKTLMLGKIEGMRRRVGTEDEMVGWHHRLNGHEFEQAPGDGEGGRPGLLQSLGLQRVGHTEWLNKRTRGGKSFFLILGFPINEPWKQDEFYIKRMYFIGLK